MRFVLRAVLSATVCVLALTSTAFAQLTVVGHTPAINAGNQDPLTDVVIDFDRALDATSLLGPGASFQVFGVQRGRVSGSFALENGGTRVRFTPDLPHFAGEVIKVILSEDLQALDTSFLRTEGYSFEFTVATASATATFTEINSLSVRDVPTTSVRVYGGLPCDLDADGFLDLVAVNEDASDLRVFLNSGDCAGGFTGYSTPTTPVGSVPSPNATADFDLDGNIDVVTANIGGSSISVALGDGAGSFASSQARGVAVLDVNGDGAPDIVSANSSSGNLTLFVNDGTGSFGSGTSFDGGCSGEWGLAAADFNEDGIQDLVVGCRFGQQVVVHLGNGDETFTAQTPINLAGQVWMIYCGDVNADGHVDVSTGNGPSGTGSILLGDGSGGLSAPTTLPSSSFVVATDLGDIDGDGDLDWILSDFGGGDFTLFENDGLGSFTVKETFQADANSSDVVFMDFDNDRDLDMLLLDEIADVVRFYENDTDAGQTFCGGEGGLCPCGNAGLPCRGCENSAGDGGVLLTTASFSPNGSGGGTVDLLGAGYPAMGTPAVVAIRGTAQENGGAGSTFGDGLLCVQAPIVRLGAAFAIDGNSSLTINHGSMAGAGTFHYQLWYRNSAASFCTPDRFNLSNGVTLVW